MARLEQYRDAIEAAIQEYDGIKLAYGDINLEAVADRVHDHYEVMMMGWDNPARVHQQQSVDSTRRHRCRYRQ